VRITSTLFRSSEATRVSKGWERNAVLPIKRHDPEGSRRGHPRVHPHASECWILGLRAEATNGRRNLPVCILDLLRRLEAWRVGNPAQCLCYRGFTYARRHRMLRQSDDQCKSRRFALASQHERLRDLSATPCPTNHKILTDRKFRHIGAEHMRADSRKGALCTEGVQELAS
jgi:hypothetical protein